MSGPAKHRRPGAFAIDQAAPDTGGSPGQPKLGDIATEAEDQLTIVNPRPRPRAGVPWGRLFIAAASMLASLAIGLAVTDLIAGLFARQGWLGWLGLGLASIAGLAFVAIILREVIGLARLRRVRRVREAATAPIPSESGARRVIAGLTSLYGSRPEMVGARAELARHEDEIVDPADRLSIAERAYMPALDAEARRIIGDAVKRVSIVTAVSPSATIDLGFVLMSHLGLIRRLAELYGGRPGALGLLKLSRMVVTHLAVTGSIALADDLIEQIVGHGLAARVSTRLGEGVLNGLLAARIGLAALDLARPLPFVALKRPRISDFVAAARASRPAADPNTGR